jgi:serine/threonine protein kinase
MTGEKILNYRIENQIAEDQLFRSFLATHTQFAKKVVVKMLKPFASEAEKTQFYEELRQLAHLQHPNLITLYDYQESPTEFYLITEFAEGKTLATYLQKFSGPIPEDKAKSLFIQILDVFTLAHQQGVMNGAIHADHIYLTPADHIKVTDLALSSFYRKKMTDLGDKETIAFLSPEQIEGRFFDFRSDIYALGILLFQILTGKLPFADFTVAEIKQKTAHEALPSAKEFYPMISTGIQQIINQATAKNPSARFASCEAMKQAILALKPEDTPVIINPASETIPAKTASKSTKRIKVPVDLSKYQKVNLAPYLLGVFVLFLVILLIRYNWGGNPQDSEVIRDVTNEARIKSLQDSVTKAQVKKAIEDSARIFGGDARKRAIIEPYIHKAKRGETLDRIARRYLVTLDTLKKLNNMNGSERLSKYEGVKIPVKAVYTLRKDEDLNVIAQKFGINAFILKEVNQLYPKPPKEPGGIPEPVIFEGKEIVVPLVMNKR